MRLTSPSSLASSIALYGIAFVCAIVVVRVPTAAAIEYHCENPHDMLCLDDDEYDEPIFGTTAAIAGNSSSSGERSLGLGDLISGGGDLISGGVGELVSETKFLRFDGSPIKKDFDYRSLKGVMHGALFSTTGIGIEGSLSFDYDDGSNCNINVKTQKNFVNFRAGRKRIQVIWNAIGMRFFLMDNGLKLGRKIRKREVDMKFIMNIMDQEYGTSGIGALAAEIETIGDCMKDFAAIFQTTSMDGAGRSLQGGNWWDFVINAFDPSDECNLVSRTFQVVEMGRTCGVAGFRVASACNTNAIQPLLTLVSQDWSLIFTGIAGAISAFNTHCVGPGMGVVSACREAIEGSCFV